MSTSFQVKCFVCENGFVWGLHQANDGTLTCAYSCDWWEIVDEEGGSKSIVIYAEDSDTRDMRDNLEEIGRYTLHPSLAALSAVIEDFCV